MGVSGSGKTTVGRLLAQKLGQNFIDGDDIHLPASQQKMAKGIPLTDDDRWPWLDRLATKIKNYDGERPLIVACSALKEVYRQRLGITNYQLVYLKGSRKLVAERLKNRKNHFMPEKLLASQLAIIEEPVKAITVSIERDPKAIVKCILYKLNL
jgi:gluconokinase